MVPPVIRATTATTPATATGYPPPRPDNRRARLGSAGLARHEAFDHPELEPLSLLDAKTLRLDKVKRPTQEVLTLKRHSENIEEALNGPGWQCGSRHMVGQEQQSAGPQDAVHLADGAAVVGNGAQPVGAHHGVERCRLERQGTRIGLAK